MSDVIFRAENLSKSYGATRALDNVNISLKKGRIYGFIGRNGAGKTTMLRIMAGLTFPTGGQIELYGARSQKDLEEQRSRLGCLIETPAFYGDMSAQANLEMQRRVLGVPDRQVIPRVLETVGLSADPRKKVRNFSTGMKQLLGVALALLASPEFLVLDEPINGIDPVGVRGLRELLRRLHTEKGVTMLISSHILAELHQVATDFIIIHEGRIVDALSHAELDEKCRRHILIETDDPAAAAVLLERQLHTVNFKILPNGKIRLYDYLDDIRTVASTLAGNGVVVTQLTYAGDDLEGYFVQAIGGEAHV